MDFKGGLWKIIVMFIIVTIFEYRTITTDASHLVNFIGGIGIPVEDLNFESVTSGYVLKAEYFLPETADEFRQKIKPQTIHRKRKSVNGTNIYDEDFNILLASKMKSNIYRNETFPLSRHTKHDNIHKHHLRSSVGDNFKSQQKNWSLYRWLVYKAMETILNKSSLSGRACMLRSICEHAAIPLNHEGGLLAEILHIILTPSASRDEVIKPSHKDYLRAEIMGRSGEDCKIAFRECTKSPMAIISTVF
ncbi:uncharacterized protein ACRADG_007354 isoform 2-T2 [Cochliomyia hominivorax]